MAEPLRIDIFSDVICPWCLIGRERLRQALARLDPDRPVAIRWLPFELNPDMPPEGMDRKAYVEAKFGGTEQARAIYDRIAEAGRGEGIAFDFSRLDRTPSTFDAHRLIWLAGQDGLGDVVKDLLFRRYFVDAADIGSPDVLLDVARDAGMDPDRARELLQGGDGADAVRGLEAVAHQMGITGVPFFVFNGRVGVSGAQAPEVLLQAIAQADALPAEDATRADAPA